MDGVVMRRPTRISVRSRALPWVLLLAAGVGPADAARQLEELKTRDAADLNTTPRDR